MQKLIIVGNGFDLAHGMKTSYADFFDSLQKSVEEPDKEKHIIKGLDKTGRPYTYEYVRIDENKVGLWIGGIEENGSIKLQDLSHGSSYSLLFSKIFNERTKTGRKNKSDTQRKTPQVSLACCCCGCGLYFCVKFPVDEKCFT